jgi:hypothetical protein
MGRKWTSAQVKSDKEIIARKLSPHERVLLKAGLFMLNKKTIRRGGAEPPFSHFEWRLEVSGYGAGVIEPLCAMGLVLKLGEILQLVEPALVGGGSPSAKDLNAARQRIAIRCRPRAFVIARVMRLISKEELPELLSHDHEFIRGLAAQRLVDTPDEGTHIYQYRFTGGTTGSFCGPILVQ